MLRWSISAVLLFSTITVAMVRSTPPAAVPVGGPVARADVAAVRFVDYCGQWYSISFDFRSRFYTCPSNSDEHASWTGEVDSWDVATQTLVFKEAYVVCKPCDIPQSSGLSLVRMRFQRLPDGQLIAHTDGGSWNKTVVTFR